MSSVSPPSGMSRSISIAVARKTLDTYKAQGDAAVKLIQSAAKVSKQVRSGHAGRLDVVG